MEIGLILGGMMGLGLWLIFDALPISRREGNLALRLQRLSAQGRMALESGARRKGPALFTSPALERLLRPLLEDAGAVVSAIYRRTGIGAPDLERPPRPGLARDDSL